MSLISTYVDDELFIMLNEDTIYCDQSRRNEVKSLDETEVLLNGWVGDNLNIQPTHNKDDVKHSISVHLWLVLSRLNP
jgi:hypothetical protein